MRRCFNWTLIKIGTGHNLPQEVPAAFPQAIKDGIGSDHEIVMDM
jgi:hypothetical protein